MKEIPRDIAQIGIALFSGYPALLKAMAAEYISFMRHGYSILKIAVAALANDLKGVRK